MLAYGVAPRRSQVATGNTYTSCYGHRFYPASLNALFAFRGRRRVSFGRGLARAFCAKMRDPATSGKASLPLPKNSTYYKGFTSGYAALVNVPFFVAPPLPPQRVSLRAALQAGGVLGGALLRLGGVRSTPRPLL